MTISLRPPNGRDRQAAYEMVRRTGQQGVSFIAVDDQCIVGFDQPRLGRARASAVRPRPVFGAAVCRCVKRERPPGRRPGLGRVRRTRSPRLPGRCSGTGCRRSDRLDRGPPPLARQQTWSQRRTLRRRARECKSSTCGEARSARLRLSFDRRGMLKPVRRPSATRSSPQAVMSRSA
jgi:hypothetical protein